MWCGSILSEAQAVEISLFQCRHDDSLPFLQVIFSSKSLFEEHWTRNSCRRCSSPDNYSRPAQFGRDRKMRIFVTSVNIIVATYVSRKFEHCYTSPHNLIQESGIFFTKICKMLKRLSILIIFQKSVN